MDITASMVKELREKTGAGMMDCKSALSESDGDMDAAVDILRTKGLAALAKKAGRATNEGLIEGTTTDDARSGSLVEVNCETDFVALNADFKAFVATVAGHVLSAAPVDDDDLMSQTFTGADKSTQDILGEQVAKIGENMSISRFTRYEVEADHGAIAVYVHGVGNIGVMVELSASTGDLAASDAFATASKDVAMQIAATSPLGVSRDDVSTEVIEHEFEIYKAQAAESGKPEQIQEKIAQGRMDKYFKEVSLLEQPFVKDADISVSKMLEDVGKAAGGDISVKRFVRFEIGGNPSC